MLWFGNDYLLLLYIFWFSIAKMYIPEAALIGAYPMDALTLLHSPSADHTANRIEKAYIQT